MIGDQIGLMSSSDINASGASGGGTVLIGGNERGQGPLNNASAVYMDPTAKITTNAMMNGHGGQVVLWSDDYTAFYGSINSQGGPQGGNGGQVETSSHHNLQAMGSVNASAPFGVAGTWLLDPADVTINNTGTTSNVVSTSGPIFTSSGNDAVINVSSIVNALNIGSNVGINTSAGVGSGTGNIYIQNTIAANNSTSTILSFNATGGIIISPGVNITAGTAPLSVLMTAGEDIPGTGVGTIAFQGNNTVTTHGGNITLSGNANNIGVAPVTAPAGQNGAAGLAGVQFVGTTFNAGSGTISVTGSGQAGGGGGAAGNNGGAGGDGISATGNTSMTAASLQLHGTGV